MSGFRLPSDRLRSSDRNRGRTVYVDVWVCRQCDETYDALPRVGGDIKCPSCGANENYLVKRRVKD